MNKLVTICIPVYNGQRTIGATLDSLVSQSYKNIKIKVFDNCSTDNTQNIIKEFVEKYSNVSLHVNESNLGGEGNYNKCLEACEGDYSGIYHSDDKGYNMSNFEFYQFLLYLSYPLDYGTLILPWD